MRTGFTVAGLVLLLAACAPGHDSTPTPTPVAGGAAAELEAARQAWQAAGSDSYTFELTNDCGECDPAARAPRRIAVRDGEVLAVEDDDLPTIPDVFASIEEALDAGRRVEVIYDPQTGAPRDVQIDMDQRPVDGGTHWILSDPIELVPIGSATELSEARRLWDALGLDDYRFQLRMTCDCPEEGSFKVEVIGDQVVEAIPLDAPARSSTIHHVTISRTFDDLEDWFTDSDTLIAEGILAVDVRTDPVMGYPRWVSVEADFPNQPPFRAEVTMDVVEALDSATSPPEPDVDDLAAVREARLRWEAAQVTAYSYTQTVHCLCPDEYRGPFEIVVHDGRIVSATWQDAPLLPDQGSDTIEEVFDQIESAIQRGTDVDVTYDPEFGHPREAVIDVEAVAVDGGRAFTIDDLLPITSGIAGQAVAGPTCPVLQDPAAGVCADRPVADATLVVFEAGGEEVARTVTAPDGYFLVSLPPGTYRIEPQPVEGLLGTPGSFGVKFGPGVIEQVTISYDTGIR